ncbi:hypothetical protein EV201_2526 [Ancylomarina subtilis]|uniref:Outer membrane lipoprotein-sorting protein n=1 Tax=Ancylomarina subtilis TaxID=1639035 RepID=A0A4Q7V9Z7_9BACT|nr:hypothetical protein [Ancylomarina subtilis]RZT93365.1 hypothetical protein EV201_2526 [Ancylomarina subtilis]
MLLFRLAFLLLILLPSISFSQKSSNYISYSMDNQTYKKGLLTKAHAEFFYDNERGILVSAYSIPNEFVKVSNRKGELKLYVPKSNTVTYTQDNTLSTENELIYYFANNRQQDLGLEKEGFTMVDSRLDGQYLIFVWEAPETMKTVKKVEVVYENENPIYAAYFDNNETIIKKIYYYDYFSTTYFQMPTKLTEISYTPERDSIVQRTIFSNIKLSNSPNSPYFNFKIPDNAKVNPSKL